MKRTMKRSLRYKLSRYIVLFIFVIQTFPVYGADDDLDQYFEDYFLEEEEKPTASAGEKPTEEVSPRPPAPVKTIQEKEPSIAAEKPSSQPALEQLHKDEPVSPSISAQAPATVAAVKQPNVPQQQQPLLSSRNPDFDAITFQPSYLDSYIDEVPYEVWDFHNFMQQVENIDRDTYRCTSNWSWSGRIFICYQNG